MKNILLKIFAFLVINYFFLLISPITHASDNFELDNSQNDTANNSSGSQDNTPNNSSKSTGLQVQISEQTLKTIADGVGNIASNISLSGSLARVASTVATVLSATPIPPAQKVGYTVLGAVVGGATHVASSSVSKMVQKSLTDAFGPDTPVPDSSETPPSPTDFISSMDEDLLLHPLEGLVNSILIYNVVILILSFYLLFNILVLIFSNKIEKKSNNVSTDNVSTDNVSTNNKIFMTFILKSIKGISVKTSIINIIIIYIIF